MTHGRFRFTVATALGLALGGAILAGCQKKADDSAPVQPGGGARPAPKQSSAELDAALAKVDDVTITVGELQALLNRESPYIRARYTSLEQKKDFLDSIIRFEILAKEALRRHYDTDPEVVRTMKEVMIQKLIKDEFDRRITPESVTEDEIKAYYQANLVDYQKPEEVRVSAIIVKSKAQADRVAAEARGDAGTTNKGFRDLVEKYTQDPDTKLRSGDLRYVSSATTDVPRPVIEAAFALAKTGDVSGAVDAGNGTFYVLKQTGRRKAMVKSIDDARAQIRNKLYRDKRVDAQKAFLEQLRGQAKIEIFEDNLAKVRIDTSVTGDGHGHELPTLPPSPSGNGTAAPDGAAPPAPPLPTPAPGKPATAPAATTPGTTTPAATAPAAHPATPPAAHPAPPARPAPRAPATPGNP
jgi:peptidyl-prolyl cis-trans isomerase C